MTSVAERIFEFIVLELRLGTAAGMRTTRQGVSVIIRGKVHNTIEMYKVTLH